MTDIEIIDYLLKKKELHDSVTVDSLEISIEFINGYTRDKEFYEDIVKKLGNRDYYVVEGKFVIERNYENDQKKY